MSSFPASQPADPDRVAEPTPIAANSNTTAARPMTVLIVVPTLGAGAAEHGAVELVRCLKKAGHHAIVAARAGRLLGDITALGGEFVALDVASKNPIVMLRNAAALVRLARRRNCDVIHALGRAGAWSASLAARRCKIGFVTGWYKGFREQNWFKRVYNGVMARGDRVYYPAHGEKIDKPQRFVRSLIGHRKQREGQILRLLGRGVGALPDMVEKMYVGLDPRLKPAAEGSVLAHLIDLERRGRVRQEVGAWTGI